MPSVVAPPPAPSEPPAPAFDSSGCVHPPVVSKCSDGFCQIPAGCFVMGSPEDEWGRGQTREQRVNVTLTRPFVVQKYEVTQKEWMAAGFANPSGKMADGTGDCRDATCPVGNVTWFEAAAYANLSSERNLPPLPPCYELDGCTGTTGTGMKCTSASTATGSVYDCAGYRLPTDAEWEYATRAGTRSAFYSGDITVIGTIGECHPDQNLLRIAWYCSNSGGATHPVGQLEPNAWGLHDVSGNAAEWVNDVSTGLPPGRGIDPGGTIGTSIARVYRGGLFNAWASFCRSAGHGTGSWDARGPGLGFRLVRTVK